MSRLLPLALLSFVAMMATSSMAAAQTNPQVVRRAVAGARPQVLVWVDEPNATRTDPDTKGFEELFASSTWLWLDNGVLLVRQGDDLVASAHYRALDNTNTFWALHNRREYTLDGSADRDPDDPTRGGATLYVTVAGEDGASITARVEISLSFTL